MWVALLFIHVLSCGALHDDGGDATNVSCFFTKPEHGGGRFPRIDVNAGHKGATTKLALATASVSAVVASTRGCKRKHDDTASSKIGKSRYIGVQPKDGKYDAYHKHKYLGRFDSEEEAAEEVRKKKKLKDIKQLEKKKKCDTVSAETGLRRFSVFEKIFGNWTPADIAAAIEERGIAPWFVLQAAGLYCSSLLGKEAPWKVSLRESWEAAGAKVRQSILGVVSNETKLRIAAARAMYTVLAGAIQRWLKRAGERDFWKLHVNRSVSKHSSIFAHLQWLGMFMPSIRGKYTVEGRRYNLVSFSSLVHTAKMCLLHKIGMELQLTSIPETLREYCHIFADAYKRIRRHLGAQVQAEDDYRYTWLLRAYLMVEMRASKIMALRITRDVDIAAFTKAMLPDCGGWIAKWAEYYKTKSTKKLIKKLAYTGPVEMLSCKACVFADNASEQLDLSSVEQIVPQMSKARRVFSQQMGYESHPVVLVRQVVYTAKL